MADQVVHGNHICSLVSNQQNLGSYSWEGNWNNLQSAETSGNAQGDEIVFCSAFYLKELAVPGQLLSLCRLVIDLSFVNFHDFNYLLWLNCCVFHFLD